MTSGIGKKHHNLWKLKVQYARHKNQYIIEKINPMNTYTDNVFSESV